MVAVDDKLLADITAAIVREVQPDEVILFGSRAGGQARADSDVDLLIVEGQPFAGERSRRQELSRIRRALWSFRLPLDLLVLSRDEINTWRGSTNHVIGRAMREGLTLYARS
jgi:predicted nucleotidyltransferase